MPVMLRYPSWAIDGVTVKVNGKKQHVKKVGVHYFGSITTVGLLLRGQAETIMDVGKRNIILCEMLLEIF